MPKTTETSPEELEAEVIRLSAAAHALEGAAAHAHALATKPEMALTHLPAPISASELAEAAEDARCRAYDARVAHLQAAQRLALAKTAP